MDADYSVELGPTAPALEIPWHDPAGHQHYVNLRLHHGSISRDPAADLATNLANEVARIPEAQQFPALARFLIDVNSPPSPWQTAKCDVWTNETDASANLYELRFEQSCYVDLVLVTETLATETSATEALPANAAALRPSLEAHQRLAKEFAHLLEANQALPASAEIVVRRCYIHRSAEPDHSDAGFCLTLFLTAYGASTQQAGQCWERAMDFAAHCLLKMQPHHDRDQAQELR